MNEPKTATQDDEREFVRHFARLFRKLDPATPITVGSHPALENMDAVGDVVDVLSYHDYGRTRADILSKIRQAREIGRKHDKPVIMTETGCLGRANPYDMALEIYSKERIGWYIWELMISEGHWGRIHGVVYPDGTVRDPSIAAALLGFFRNRGPDTIPAVINQEKAVTRLAALAEKWLEAREPSWAEGLALAETAANLLEAGELIPMYDPPSRKVELLRSGAPDVPVLRELLRKWLEILGQHAVG